MIQELKQSVSSVHMARKDLKCFTQLCGNLYYKMSDGVLARCLGVEEAAKRLEEVHDKVCGTTTPVNLSRRLQRQGDYWPNMARDAKAKAREEACLKCTWMPDRAECAFIDVVDWRQPYIEYLTKGTLPDDRYEANKLKKMAKRYIVNDGKLFKRGLSGILLRCLSGDEAMEVMHQSHAGTLAEHQGGRKLFPYLLQSEKKGK